MDSTTGSTDEYETDDYHPPSDCEEDVKFLKGGRLSRSPERNRQSPRRRGGAARTAAAASASASAGAAVTRTSPRKKAGSSSNASNNGASTSNSGNKGGKRVTNRRSTTSKSKQDDDSYQGDESDESSDEIIELSSTNNIDNSSSQKYATGTSVSKLFNGSWFSGSITQYHVKEKLYTVQYDDGDEEDYSEKEVGDLITNHTTTTSSSNKTNAVATGKSKSSEQSNDGSGSDDDDDNFFSHVGVNSTKKRKVIQYSDDSDDDSSLEDLTSKKQQAKKLSTGLSSDEESDNSDNNFFSKKRVVAKKQVAEVHQSDSSDSDIEIVVQSTTTNQTSTSTRTSPRRTTQQQQRAPTPSIDIKAVPSPKKKKSPAKQSSQHTAIRARAESALEYAKRAREEMKRAQNYHAEDVEVKLPTPRKKAAVESIDVDDSSVEEVEALKPAATAAAVPKPKEAVYKGDLLRITLRYKDSTNQKDCQAVLRIRSDEPLRMLKERFQGGGSIASLKFDGDKLDMNKTPQFYDMEDEDLVDAVVQGGTAGGGGGKAPPDVVKLLVRRSGTTASHEFGMPKTACLSKLIAAVCEKFKVPHVVLEYNGRSLNPLRSCYDEGISNNATIDAIVGETINLEFRVNGDSKDVHSINAMQRGTFRHAMEVFAAKKKCSVADCKFLFDGEVLKATTTMESLELEGDEIIDVQLTVAALNPLSMQDVDGDVIMADAAAVRAAVISVKTVRNQTKAKPKTWKISTADKISKLKLDYTKHYKTCKQVKFYFNNSCINAESKSLMELGITDGTVLYAMENGKPYKIQ